MPRPLNVLFVVADDHQHAAIGAHGHATVRTPTLDGIVKAGATFERCYIMGGCHAAVCVPSRAALLAGTMPCDAQRAPLREGGACTTAIEPRCQLLPERFRDAGWDTHAVGKWHNDIASFQRSFAGGRALFFGGMAPHDAVPVHDYDPLGRYLDTAPTRGAKFSSELFCDAACAFLEERRARNAAPFFLYLSLTSPHDPRTPPDGFASLYDPARIPLPPNFASAHPFDNGALRLRDELLAPSPRAAATLQAELAAYYGLISHHDAQLGRVLAALELSGERERTLIVYVSDHGLALGQHGLLGKQNLYEHSVRVPLLMAGPGIRAGQRAGALVHSFDIFPTLCELAGLEPPPNIAGQSFGAVLRGGDPHHRTEIFAYYQRSQAMLTDGQWKRIDYAVNGSRRTQLFDLQADPHERHDRAADAECAEIRARLGVGRERWQELVAASAEQA